MYDAGNRDGAIHEEYPKQGGGGQRKTDTLTEPILEQSWPHFVVLEI